ncbi:MBOAT family O-acyltransferase [Oleispirillum naphthae]|uniref:MBOAT family O-acyltransferase n=1 Tax=Oleispirillum naphthae TaxID=2838853 RepID=UPI0030823FB8
MLFQSPQFLFLFVATLGAYAAMRGDQGRLVALTLASLLFYAYAGWRDVILLAVLLVANHQLSRVTERLAGTRRGLYALWAAVLFNLAPLIFYKYLYFLMQIAAPAWGAELGVERYEIPLGSSFYTFLLIAYHIDIHHGLVKRERQFVRMVLFSTFFAHVAGPIMRARELLPQFDHLRPLDYAGLRAGSVFILLGLLKKVVVADQVAPLVDALFGRSQTEALSFFSAWGAGLGFGLQIYSDFSGYSDIALGLGLCFGIRLRRNFEYPYLARDPSDFWRRWHITLSEWFRDYVYIPLGGNRNGGAATLFNLAATMVLCGLWHGASWTFIVWGGIHAALLAFYHLCRRPLQALAPLPAVLTFLVAMIAWVFFRAGSLAEAGSIAGSMLAPDALGSAAEGWRCLGLALLLPGLQYVERLAMSDESALRAAWRGLPAWIKGGAAAAVAVLIVLHIHSQAVYIYFRF